MRVRRCAALGGVFLWLATAGWVASAAPPAIRPLGQGGPAPSASSTSTSATPTASSTATASATATAPASASATSSAQPTVDAGPADETADQHSRRKSYVEKEWNKIKSLVHAGDKHVTDDEREAIRKHWRRAMRLWRVRNLAETAGDQASVSRVDALLGKADDLLEARLKELNAKAPKKDEGSK